MAIQLGMDLEEAQKQRVLQINELDEIRQDALLRTMLIQNNERHGMINLLSKSNLILGIGHCYLTQGIKI